MDELDFIEQFFGFDLSLGEQETLSGLGEVSQPEVINSDDPGDTYLRSFQDIDSIELLDYIEEVKLVLPRLPPLHLLIVVVLQPDVVPGKVLYVRRTPGINQQFLLRF